MSVILKNPGGHLPNLFLHYYLSIPVWLIACLPHCYFTILKNRKRALSTFAFQNCKEFIGIQSKKNFWNPARDSLEPYQFILKNSQNGTFLPVVEIWTFFGPNHLIWTAMKVWFSDFIQDLSQAPSNRLSKQKSEDKLDYLKNPPQDFKKYFCF